MLLKHYVQHYVLYRYSFIVLQCEIIDKCKGRRKKSICNNNDEEETRYK